MTTLVDAELLGMAMEVAEEVANKRGLRTLQTQQGLSFLDEDGHKVESRSLVQAVRSRLHQRLTERARAQHMARWGEEDIVTVRVLDADSGEVETLDGAVRGVISRAERKRITLSIGQIVPARVLDPTRGLLSFSHPSVLAYAMRREVPEVATGEVKIVRIAREAGVRSKVAVRERDPDIDPVCACIGRNASRIAAVRPALSGESVDIIPWSRDIEMFVADALAPAQVLSVVVEKGNGIAHVTVLPEHTTLAIGPGGLNAKLAMRLTGYGIDIL